MGSSLQLKNLPPSFDVLIPFHGHDEELLRELSVISVKVYSQNSKIMVTENLNQKPIWAQDWWPQSQQFKVDDPKSAAKTLKNRPTMGCYYFISKSTLASQISLQLKLLEERRIDYKPGNPFNFKFFAWTLVNDTIIYCDKPFSRFPFGWHEFNEDKSTPPNRAYLKLWEIFTVHGCALKKSDEVLEIGASPGGWSWVLSQLTKKVYAIDRSPLADQIMRIPNIIFEAKDAFKLDPTEYKNCTWLFSDLICTPEKLYETVTYWMTNSSIKNYVCTIKFKGNCDYTMLEKFAKIENSKLIHLYQNKNEVTWIKTESSRA